MADEIYINIGQEFQQPYQGQVIVQARQPVIRQSLRQVPANAQTPSTYQYRSPFTYQFQVSAQEPNIRNKQSPFTYQATGQSPFIYQRQSPFTYRHPVINQGSFDAQQTYPYPASARQPTIKDAQQPYPYIANSQTSLPYIHRSPFPYTFQARSPFIFITRSPFPYTRNAITQQPHIRQVSSPVIANNQQPYSYQNWPGTGQQIDPESGADFYQVIGRSPFTSNVQGRVPQSFQAIEVNTRSPQTYNAYNPSPFTYSGQAVGFFYHPGIGEDIPYRTPISNGQAQQPNPYIASRQINTVTYTNEGAVPYIAQGQGQQPVSNNGQQPLPTSQGQGQQPVQRNFQQPATYARQGRSPFTYDHRSPFTYTAIGRSPFTYRGPVETQQPSSAQESNAADIQQPYPFIGQARQPLTYDHRSPFTYDVTRNKQQPNIRDIRAPSTYQHTYQFTYEHQSPFLTQQPYSTTRPIGPLAKVKGVFVNQGGSVAKAQEVYVTKQTTVEKIHQSVPNAQFSKG